MFQDKIRQDLIDERDRLPKEDQAIFLLTELIVEIRTQRAESEKRIESAINIQQEMQDKLAESLPMLAKLIPAGRS